MKTNKSEIIGYSAGILATLGLGLYLRNKLKEKNQELVTANEEEQMFENNLKGVGDTELKPVYRIRNLSLINKYSEDEHLDVWLLKNTKLDEYGYNLISFIPINSEEIHPHYTDSYKIDLIEKIGYKMQPPIHTPILNDEND